MQLKNRKDNKTKMRRANEQSKSISRLIEIKIQDYNYIANISHDNKNFELHQLYKNKVITLMNLKTDIRNLLDINVK